MQLCVAGGFVVRVVRNSGTSTGQERRGKTIGEAAAITVHVNVPVLYTFDACVYALTTCIFRWFCHFDDDVYVNVPKLTNLLGRYNPQWQKIYIGHPPNLGRNIKVRYNLAKPIGFYVFLLYYFCESLCRHSPLVLLLWSTSISIQANTTTPQIQGNSLSLYYPNHVSELYLTQTCV